MGSTSSWGDRRVCWARRPTTETIGDIECGRLTAQPDRANNGRGTGWDENTRRKGAPVLQIEELVGLDLLAGKTFYDTEGHVLRQEQFHGEIVEADGSTTWIQPAQGGDRQWVPTDLLAFRPAPGGTYRLASTGQVV